MRSLRAVIVSGVVFAVLGCSSGLHYTYPPPGRTGPVLDLGTVQYADTNKKTKLPLFPTPPQDKETTTKNQPLSLEDTYDLKDLWPSPPSSPVPAYDAGSPEKDMIRPPVRYWIERLSGKERATFMADLARLEAVRPVIERIFEENDIPKELSYLCLIESGARANAVSPSGAVGYWQFMPDTAKRYGLQINRYVDERTNLEKSTKAAALYLRHLYTLFGDWYLAIAAYNAGEGAVARLMDNHRITSFWEIHEKMDIKNETIDFVPKFIATLILASNACDNGSCEGKPASVAGLARGGYLSGLESAPSKKPSRLAQASQTTVTDTPISSSQRRDALSDDSKKLSPADSNDGQAHVVRYTVQRGDTLYSIAKRHRTTVKAIIRSNGLKNPGAIKAGMKLSIPQGEGRPDATSLSGGSSPQKEGTTRNPAKRQETVKYTVKKGDTLWAIARKFGTEPSEIKKANNRRTNRPITPGDVLVIKIPAKT